MVHKILTDHKKELKDHEQEALKAMRTKIQGISGGIKNIKVTIYLDDMEPVTIVEGAGDNKLVIQFKKSGEIDFEWEQKTFGQKLYEKLTDFAWDFVDMVLDTLKSLIPLGKEALVGVVRKQIKWTLE